MITLKGGALAAGGGADGPRSGPPPPPGRLPCLKSNNSNENEEKEGVLTGGLWKSAYLLAETVKKYSSDHGIERLGFLTLTFKANITEKKEAERRFNSLRTGVLLKRYPKFIKVSERQTRGAWHFHLVVVLAEGDIRTCFDFEAVADNDYKTAGAQIRAEWAFWRKTAKKYGFGRTELLPVESTAAAIGRYVGKYLGKHMGNRRPEDKGARLVSYSKGSRVGSTRFSWCGVKGWLWRAKYRRFAERLGFDDEGAFAAWAYQEYGPKWAFKLSEEIAAEVLHQYPSPAHAAADGHVMLPEEIPATASNVTFLRVDPVVVSARPVGSLRARTLRDAVESSPVRGFKAKPRIMFAPGGARAEELPTVWTGRVGLSVGKAS